MQSSGGGSRVLQPSGELAAYAGLRVGELRALRWRDADFAKRLVHVRRNYVLRDEGVPKSGRVRSVPMIDQVARGVDELSRREHFTGDEDLIFCNQVGRYFEDSALRRRFYAARDQAGLKPLRVHDLRPRSQRGQLTEFPA